MLPLSDYLNQGLRRGPRGTMGRLKARMGELGKKLPLAVAEGQAGDGLGEEVMER